MTRDNGRYGKDDVTDSPVKLPAGWGYPGNARKCHYFPEGDSMALCRRWGFYTGRRQPDEGTSRDDCSVCRRELDKLKAES